MSPNNYNDQNQKKIFERRHKSKPITITGDNKHFDCNDKYRSDKKRQLNLKFKLNLNLNLKNRSYNNFPFSTKSNSNNDYEGNDDTRHISYLYTSSKTNGNENSIMFSRKNKINNNLKSVSFEKENTSFKTIETHQHQKKNASNLKLPPIEFDSSIIPSLEHFQKKKSKISGLLLEQMILAKVKRV